jgi:hypothetical protein
MPQKAMDFIRALGIPSSHHFDETGILLLTWEADKIKVW